MSYTWDSWREGDDPPLDGAWTTPQPPSKLEKLEQIVCVIYSGVMLIGIAGGIVGGTGYGIYKLIEYIAR